MSAANPPRARAVRNAFLAALAYVAVSSLYIWLSDRIAFTLLGGNPAALLRLSTYKGFGFVLLTGLALFALLWRLGAAASRAALADTARQEKQGQWEALFARGPEAAFVVDGGGRFVAANQAAGRLFRCRPEEIVGRFVWELSLPGQVLPGGAEAAALALIAEVPEGEVRRAPWRCQRPDGSELEAEISYAALPGREVSVLAWVRDLTAARETGRELEVANERLRLLVEGAPHFFFYAQELDGTVSYVSPTVTAITGRPVGEWLAQRHWFATDNPINEEARRLTGRHLKGSLDGAPIVFEVRHADGRPVLLEAYEYGRYRGGELIGLQGIAHDVSARRRAERVQHATLKISQAANSARSLQELFVEIHAIVAELMPAENLYIALHDPETDLLAFPYFVDQHDLPPAPRKPRKGLTEYVLHTGEPLLASPGVYEELERRGELELIGAPSIDWLGVPLKIRDRTIGVLAVQSYRDGLRFGEDEKAILMFVSTQVAMAIERTRAEEALRDSEERYRTLVELSPDGILVLLDGTCVFANLAAARLAGVGGPHELRGTSILGLVHPAGPGTLPALVARVSETQTPAPWQEERLRRADGSEVDVEVAAVPFSFQGKPAAQVVIRDISARKAAEEALRGSEQKLRDIIEHSTNLFYSHSREGLLTFVSPQTRQFLDCEPDEALVHWTEFATDNPANRKAFEATELAFRTGERQPTYELELVGKKGRKIWVEVNEAPVVREGATIAMVGALTDITARKQVQQELAESEERYRTLVELSPDGIAVHSEGRLVFCNTTGVRILGYGSLAEIIGKPVLEFVHPDFRELAASRIRQALQRGEPQPSIEEKFIRADGGAIDVEVASSPFIFRGKPAVHVVLRDITPRKQLEAHLRHGQKMEAIGRLAGGVAHDFNNLLQALLSTAQVLRARSGDPVRVASLVGELEAHVRRGAALARQLLLFARREPLKAEALELNQTVADAANLLRRLVPENIHLVLGLTPAPLLLDADRGQLEQVLVNLVVNAADAMPDGGEVVIYTGSNEDREAWLEVRDSGIGIPEEMLARIFEPFFTTKDPERGTGLGLSVVHGIVAAHGGRMEVASTVGSGTTFRVLLPLVARGDVEVPAEATPESGPAEGQGERVLVVEDEQGAREGVREILELLNYNVTAVGSGEEAEALPVQEPFTLLLTDLLLPGVHGGELASRLVRRWPSLRVIVMSGYAEDEAVRRGVREGSVRFLKKPFDMAALAREIHAALAEG